MYTVKIERGLRNNPDAAALRTEVFVQEQGFKEEFDDNEDSAVHAVLYDGGEAVATARAYCKNQREIYTLGRVAVKKAHRGKGLGAVIVKEIEKHLCKIGAQGVELSAQEQAIGFYERLGYIPEGDTYMDEHVPHRRMKKMF